MTEALIALLLATIAVATAKRMRRIEKRLWLTDPAHHRDRLHVMRKIDEVPDGEFKRMYRVDRSTFNSILQKIRPRIERRMPRRAHTRCHALPPKLMLAVALRFLVGGSYLDITFGYEISRYARPRRDTAAAPRALGSLRLAPVHPLIPTAATLTCADPRRRAAPASIARSMRSLMQSTLSTCSTLIPRTRTR